MHFLFFKAVKSVLFLFLFFPSSFVSSQNYSKLCGWRKAFGIYLQEGNSISTGVTLFHSGQTHFIGHLKDSHDLTSEIDSVYLNVNYTFLHDKFTNFII